MSVNSMHVDASVNTLTGAGKVQQAIHVLHHELQNSKHAGHYNHYHHRSSSSSSSSSNNSNGVNSCNGTSPLHRSSLAATAPQHAHTMHRNGNGNGAHVHDAATVTSDAHVHALVDDSDGDTVTATTQCTRAHGTTTTTTTTTRAAATAAMVVAPSTVTTERIAYADFLHRRSFEFVLCVGLIACNGFYFLIYDLARLSRRQHDVMLHHVHAPWAIYRWLGSGGVDVADTQWYHFITCLPPVLPFVVVFLAISRRLRRHGSSITTTTTTSSNGHGELCVDASRANGHDGSRCGAPQHDEHHRHRHDDDGSDDNNVDANTTRQSACDDDAVCVGVTTASTAVRDAHAPQRDDSAGDAVGEVTTRRRRPWHALWLPLLRRRRRDGRASVATWHTSSSSSSSSSCTQQQLQQQQQHAQAVLCAPLRERDVARMQWLHIVCGGLLALGISGPAVVYGVVLMLVNYVVFAQLHTRVSLRVCMACMWTWHVATLFLMHYAYGYCFAWLDRGVFAQTRAPVMRWTVHYNMTMLRLIAYNCDAWEAHARGAEQRQQTLRTHERTCVACAALRDAYAVAAAAPAASRAAVDTSSYSNNNDNENNNRRHGNGSSRRRHAPHHHHHALAPPAGGVATLPFAEALCCYKCRSACPQPLEAYTLLGYFGYLLYPPLYLAGPMISYNAYVSYVRWPTRGMVGEAVWRYALRVAASALLLVTLMHYVYIVALLRSKTNYRGDGALMSTSMPLVDALPITQRSAVLFMMLAFLWLKFDVIWKLSRLIAILDGVEPPEDMRRCFINTVNIQGFWRDWHASFNLWIVRYMYIPMGGSKRKHLSIFPIFIFIAAWHDLDLRLLYWALCICVCLLPELAVTRLFASRRSRVVRALRQRKLLWRYVRTLGCTLGMLELVCINLVGFAVGASGVRKGLCDLYASVTWRYVFMVGTHFFMGATIAIQTRDQEAYELQQQKLRYHLALT